VYLEIRCPSESNALNNIVYAYLDLNKFNKKLKDTTAIERDKLVLDVELEDQTAPAEWFFNGEPIKTSDRLEGFFISAIASLFVRPIVKILFSVHLRITIKNVGGGKHQLIFNNLQMGDAGEITCKSGDLVSSCFLDVKKGEEKPMIRDLDDVEAPVTRPITVTVPYKSTYRNLYIRST
jgi:hypothetical protein